MDIGKEVREVEFEPLEDTPAPVEPAVEPAAPVEEPVPA